jgi:hypothetical protein
LAFGHKGICLQPRQFSCWEAVGGAQNHYALLERAQRLLAGEPLPPLLLDSVAAAEGCLAGSLIDALFGATHYIADWLNPWPVWARGRTPVAFRHGHLFFADVP